MTLTAKLALTELKLFLREPLVLTFVFAFPVVTVLVLGGVFDADDPAFEGVLPSDYYVAAYLGVVLAAIGLIMLPVHVAAYREQGVLRRFDAAGFPAWAFPAAQVVTGAAVAAVGIAVLLVTARFSYGVPAVDDVGRTVVGVVLGALAFISLGVLMGTVLPNPRAAQGVGLLLFFPMFLLAGGGPPPEAMSPAMRTFSDWLPLTHVVRAVQEPWLGIGSGTDHLLVVTGVFVASTTAWLLAVGALARPVQRKAGVAAT